MKGLEESKKLLEEENQKLLEQICALEDKQVLYIMYLNIRVCNDSFKLKIDRTVLSNVLYNNCKSLFFETFHFRSVKAKSKKQ